MVIEARRVISDRLLGEGGEELTWELSRLMEIIYILMRDGNVENTYFSKLIKLYLNPAHFIVSYTSIFLKEFILHINKQIENFYCRYHFNFFNSQEIFERKRAMCGNWLQCCNSGGGAKGSDTISPSREKYFITKWFRSTSVSHMEIMINF